MKLLFLGDVVGESGVGILERRLYKLKRRYEIDFTIINGENSAVGNGISEQSFRRLIQLGADVVTGGNHSFHRLGSEQLHDDTEALLRPANYPDGVSGRGVYVADLFPVKIAVVSLMGVVDLEPLENPFFAIDRIIADLDTPNIFVDIHAEATSEKKALGYYLNGRVTGVFGTHTHVQTADEQVLSGGTAYITDVGMCGPEHSVLGVASDIIIEKLKYHTPVKFEPAEGAAFINGVVVDFDEKTGRARSVERIVER